MGWPDAWIAAIWPAFLDIYSLDFWGDLKGMDGSWEIFRGLEVVELLEIYTPQKTNVTMEQYRFFFELEIIYLYSCFVFLLSIVSCFRV